MGHQNFDTGAACGALCSNLLLRLHGGTCSFQAEPTSICASLQSEPMRAIQDVVRGNTGALIAKHAQPACYCQLQPGARFEAAKALAAVWLRSGRSGWTLLVQRRLHSSKSLAPAWQLLE